MEQIINFFSENFKIESIGYFLLFPFVILWVRSVLFVTKDISQRTENVWYQIFCIILVALLTPLIWFPLYFIIRPYRKLDDIEWRNITKCLWINCLECWELNNMENNFCILCWTSLKIECKECKNKYSKTYDYCPICWGPNLELE